MFPGWEKRYCWYLYRCVCVCVCERALATLPVFVGRTFWARERLCSDILPAFNIQHPAHAASPRTQPTNTCTRKYRIYFVVITNVCEAKNAEVKNPVYPWSRSIYTSQNVHTIHTYKRVYIPFHGQTTNIFFGSRHTHTNIEHQFLANTHSSDAIALPNRVAPSLTYNNNGNSKLQ